MEGLRPEPSVRWDFPSAQWLSLPYRGQNLISNCWRRNPEGPAWAGSVPFKCVFSPFPALGLLPLLGWVLKQGSPCGLSAYLGHKQSSELSLMCCLCRGQQLFTLLCLDTALGPSPLCPSQAVTPLSPSLGCSCPVLEPHYRMGLESPHGLLVSNW